MPAITFHGHSAVSLRSDGRQLFVDPGALSDLSQLAAASAILVTHAHPDHLAVPSVVEASAPVWAPEDAITQPAQAGVPADRLHAVAPGRSFTAAGFEVVARRLRPRHGWRALAERATHGDPQFPVQP